MNGGTKEIAPLVEALLRLAFRQHIVAPDADAGIEQLISRADLKATGDAWCAAVSDALAARYIHDPVRLPAGALQCHWHLELTPAGVEAVRRRPKLRIPTKAATYSKLMAARVTSSHKSILVIS